jgi:hypothetical protein
MNTPPKVIYEGRELLNENARSLTGFLNPKYIYSYTTQFSTLFYSILYKLNVYILHRNNMQALSI